MSKKAVCTHCGAPLGEARLLVNHPAGLSGVFCIVDKDCFSIASAQSDAVQSRRLHADVETVLASESEPWERAATP